MKLIISSDNINLLEQYILQLKDHICKWIDRYICCENLLPNDIKTVIYKNPAYILGKNSKDPEIIDL